MDGDGSVEEVELLDSEVMEVPVRLSDVGEVVVAGGVSPERKLVRARVVAVVVWGLKVVVEVDVPKAEFGKTGWTEGDSEAGLKPSCVHLEMISPSIVGSPCAAVSRQSPHWLLVFNQTSPMSWFFSTESSREVR